MTCWRAVLIVFADLDVRLPGRRRFQHQLAEREIEEAIESFTSFPGLVADLTGGRAGIAPEIVCSDRPLDTLSRLGRDLWWPAPEDIRPELEEQSGLCDSVFVLWPQNDFARRMSVPSGGWGLGMGASDRSCGATYATVANVESWVWQIPIKGEVWLHEWLHGVCWHFAQRGYRMPDGDADGGDRHGYVQSPVTGWTDYYRDLMNGRVLDGGALTGIATNAWDDPIAEAGGY